MTEANAPTKTPQRNSRRVPLVVGGAAVSAIAVLFLALGGLALVADSHKDTDGYLTSSDEQFTSHGRALVSENLDVDLDGAEALVDSSDLGKVRLDVASKTGESLFVGVARTNEVDNYLRGVSHSLVTDLDLDPFTASYDQRDGARRPDAPAGQHIWAASSHGAGDRTLEWEAKDGNWSVVVMNADGSSGVNADISVGAQLGLLDGLGWGALGGGAVLLGVAAGLIALGTRPPGSTPAPAPVTRVPLPA